VGAVERPELSGRDRLATHGRNLRYGDGRLPGPSRHARRSVPGASRQYTSRSSVRCAVCAACADWLKVVASDGPLPPADTDSRKVRW
jgi:hypothetical protein